MNEIGEFIGHEDEWVVIQAGVVLKITPDEKEALAFIEHLPGMFVLYQVNHEYEVTEIDEIVTTSASDKHDTSPESQRADIDRINDTIDLIYQRLDEMRLRYPYLAKEEDEESRK